MYVCGNDDTAEMEGRNWPSPIEEGSRQKKRERSSLLFGGLT